MSIKPSFWTPDQKSTPPLPPPVKSLTVVFVTSRKEPEVKWFMDSLVNQVRANDDLRVIIIDALNRTPDELGVLPSDQIRSVIISAPKPNVWQGTHRITTQDWWAKSNALNTAVCLCKTEWIAFVDDRCVLSDTWLESVRQAMRMNYAVAGSYEKREGMEVEGGIIKSSGIVVAKDNRMHESWRSSPIPANCGYWYGCSNALPLEWVLKFNGFPEKCDSVSFEDIITGHLIQNNGFRIAFDQRMHIIEDRSVEKLGVPMKRSSKEKHPHDVTDKTHRILEWARTAKVSDNPFNICDMRKHILDGGTFPTPDPSIEHRDWFDGQLLKEM
jgi:Glycosyl transferase family 2